MSARKRPVPESHSNQGGIGPSSKRACLRSNSPAGSFSVALSFAKEPRLLKVYVVQAKMDANAIGALYRIIDRSASMGDGTHWPGLQFELCPEGREADVILTAIRMKKRLERHISWDIAEQKAIVTPNWLIDSDKAGYPLPYTDYMAIPEGRAPENCPDSVYSNPSSFETGVCIPAKGEISRALRHYFSVASGTKPTDAIVFDNWRARYAVQRASPLVCPNQDLANELSVLCRNRELEGLAANALAYERAIGVIKSYPFAITHDNFQTDLANLPSLGEKIQSKIREYIDHHRIEEAETIRSSDRFQALSLLTSVYGIGLNKACTFYDMGVRTMADLERYYDISSSADRGSTGRPTSFSTALQGLEATGGFTPNEDEDIPALTIPVAVKLKDELDEKIPRAEVEEMRDVISRELEVLQPGCASVVVGGYRRGKLMSNDMDIVITCLGDERGFNVVPGLCKRLTTQLYRKGLVTHVMRPPASHAYNASREEHRDSIEIALTVFKLPRLKEAPLRLHRRVDLIFVLPESYWTTVIGWSGSKLFQRDLRLWAKREKGMKFDSTGLSRRRDSKRFLPKTEEEVFQILGLPWVDPTMRNADV